MLELFSHFIGEKIEDYSDSSFILFVYWTQLVPRYVNYNAMNIRCVECPQNINWPESAKLEQFSYSLCTYYQAILFS